MSGSRIKKELRNQTIKKNEEIKRLKKKRMKKLKKKSYNSMIFVKVIKPNRPISKIF